MAIILSVSIIITTLAFCYSVDLFVKYNTRPKTIEDELVDDLINDKITFKEFDERLNELVRKENKEKIKRERIEKIKKLNHESR